MTCSLVTVMIINSGIDLIKWEDGNTITSEDYLMTLPILMMMSWALLWWCVILGKPIKLTNYSHYYWWWWWYSGDDIQWQTTNLDYDDVCVWRVLLMTVQSMEITVLLIFSTIDYLLMMRRKLRMVVVWWRREASDDDMTILFNYILMTNAIWQWWHYSIIDDD